jgi:hypothetical protein
MTYKKIILLFVIVLAVAGAIYYTTSTSSPASSVKTNGMFGMYTGPQPTSTPYHVASSVKTNGMFSGPRPTSKEECAAMGGDPMSWNSCDGINYCCGVCKGIHGCGSGLHDCACNE